jgi:hypothetical protein
MREHKSALKLFKLPELLKGMREEMENLLDRLSQTFKAKRDQLIFLINNLDLILTITSVRLSLSLSLSLIQIYIHSQIDSVYSFVFIESYLSKSIFSFTTTTS